MLNKKGYVLVYAIALITVLLILIASLSHITMSRTVWANRQVALINETVQARRVIDLVTVDLENRLSNYRKELYHFMDEIDAYLNGDEETAPFRNIEQIYSVSGEYEIIIRDLTKEPCDFSEVKDPNASACFNGKNDDYKPSPYTRPYDIVYNGKRVIAQKRFFISIIPSFLYFALGSKTDVNLHGGAYIIGDIFINRRLYYANSANYLVDDKPYNIISTFPSINSKSKIIFSTGDFDIRYCRQSLSNLCFTGLESGHFYRPTDELGNDTLFQVINSTFDLAEDIATSPPRLTSYEYRFLDVNFEESFVHYINDAIFEELNETNKHEWLVLGDNELTRNFLVDELQGYVGGYLIEEDNPKEITLNSTFNRSIYFNGDLVLEAKNLDSDESVFELRTDLNSNEEYYTFKYNNNEWIIVNGNLTIKNLDPNINPILIDANFLVLGDIIINGNVLFSSSTYVLGEAVIHDANINLVPTLTFPSYDNDGNDIEIVPNNLVLSVNGSIQFSRINEFKNDNLGNLQLSPSIRGFFFSNSNVQVYTVSSYLVIEGGIFSQDSKNLVDGRVVENEYIRIIGEDETEDEYNNTNSIGLLINSIRGVVDPGELAPTDPDYEPFKFYRTGRHEDYINFNSVYNARFVMKYSPSVIQHQPKGLPLNTQLNYVIEDIRVIRK